MHKRSMIIIRSQKGEQRSSLIRSISQLLIGTGQSPQFKYEELGLRDNIASIIQMDTLKLGVVAQVNEDDGLIKIVSDLLENACDLIISVQYGAEDKSVQRLTEFAEKKGVRTVVLESNWAEKLGVNFLRDDQNQVILDEIDLLLKNR